MGTSGPRIPAAISPSARATRIEAAHKRISNAVAYGLMVYTALQIFLTMRALEKADNTLLPMLALVALVGAIIPLYRRMEKKWDAMAAFLADDRAALDQALRRARLTIWAVSIGLPLLVTVVIEGILAMVAA